MPTIKTIIPLEADKYYNIYNRGNNYEKIYYKEENYYYFLKKFKEYLYEFIEVYAYCLLPNHFHFLIKVKDAIPSRDGILEDNLDNLNNKEFPPILQDSNLYIKSILI
ncbi:MAG: hypothetical protein JXB17_13870 [Bacteroidales bacterium]|nr:hypothetical protein [Bacteroidales bacterium]